MISFECILYNFMLDVGNFRISFSSRQLQFFILFCKYDIYEHTHESSLTYVIHHSYSIS